MISRKRFFLSTCFWSLFVAYVRYTYINMLQPRRGQPCLASVDNNHSPLSCEFDAVSAVANIKLSRYQVNNGSEGKVWISDLQVDSIPRARDDVTYVGKVWNTRMLSLVFLLNLPKRSSGKQREAGCNSRTVGIRHDTLTWQLAKGIMETKGDNLPERSLSDLSLMCARRLPIIIVSQ